LETREQEAAGSGRQEGKDTRWLREEDGGAAERAAATARRVTAIARRLGKREEVVAASAPVCGGWWWTGRVGGRDEPGIKREGVEHGEGSGWVDWIGSRADVPRLVPEAEAKRSRWLFFLGSTPTRPVGHTELAVVLFFFF
jgi:hypothetical protein